MPSLAATAMVCSVPTPAGAPAADGPPNCLGGRSRPDDGAAATLSRRADLEAGDAERYQIRVMMGRCGCADASPGRVVPGRRPEWSEEPPARTAHDRSTLTHDVLGQRRHCGACHHPMNAAHCTASGRVGNQLATLWSPANVWTGAIWPVAGSPSQPTCGGF